MGAVMNIQHLRYFLTIVRCGTLSGAARELHVAQPALSATLAKIEDEIGVKLFDRVRGRLILNEKGKIFSRGCLDICEDYDRMLERVHRLVQREWNELTVGILDIGFPQQFILDFLAANPGIQVNSNLFFQPAGQEFESFHCDLLIMPGPVEMKGVECRLIHSDPLFLTMLKTHPLAGCKQIALQDLNGVNLILLGANSYYGRLINNLLSQNRIVLASCCSSTERQLRQLLEKQQGVCVTIPDIWNTMPDADGLVHIPIDTSVRRQCYFVYSAKRSISPLATHFMDYICNFYH